jgi:hypothetical protein
MVEQWINAEFLQEFASAVVLVSLITQFTKEIFDLLFTKLNVKVPTKYVVYLWSIVVICLGKWYGGQFLVNEIPIYLLSGIPLSFTAMKTFETVTGDGYVKVSKIQQYIK